MGAQAGVSVRPGSSIAFGKLPGYGAVGATLEVGAIGPGGEAGSEVQVPVTVFGDGGDGLVTVFFELPAPGIRP